MKEPKQSGRESARFTAGTPAVLHDEGRDYACTAVSLSRTGVLLVGQLPWPATPAVDVTIRSAPGDVKVNLSGNVVHVLQDEESGETRIGLEFHELDENNLLGLELLISRVVEGMAPASLETLPPGAAPRMVREALELIPVAHRIALAGRAQLRERRFLRQDTTLQVLEGLARNPNISLAEIKDLARLHQILPTTVEVMAEDRRWMNDEEMQILLATHPRVALELAEKVIARMKDRTLRKLIRNPGLNPTIKERLLRRFSHRELRGW
jgi:hypothetical protein